MQKNDPKYELSASERAVLGLAAVEVEKKKAEAGPPPDPAEIHDRIVHSRPNASGMQALAGSIPEQVIQEMAALRPAYYEAIDRGNPRKLEAVLDKGFPVDFKNPATGETALHRLAASGARAAIRAILAREQCNFLIRDNQGRLPSELAYLYGRDPALARLLGNKERKQAHAEGKELVRRPSWMLKRP
jgi:hypothetical protein